MIGPMDQWMDQRMDRWTKCEWTYPVERCDNDPRIIASIANLFWLDRKVEKARSWFNRSVTLNPDIGDHWAMFYKFELQHGTEEQQEAVVRRCVEAEPRWGGPFHSHTPHTHSTPFQRCLSPTNVLRHVSIPPQLFQRLFF